MYVFVKGIKHNENEIMISDEKIIIKPITRGFGLIFPKKIKECEYKISDIESVDYSSVWHIDCFTICEIIFLIIFTIYNMISFKEYYLQMLGLGLVIGFILFVAMILGRPNSIKIILKNGKKIHLPISSFEMYDCDLYKALKQKLDN